MAKDDEVEFTVRIDRKLNDELEKFIEGREEFPSKAEAVRTAVSWLVNPPEGPNR